jgi:hypothetical protein
LLSAWSTLLDFLYRIIYLNAVPEGISFSSIRGNLTVAIGGQLHTISYKKYLPKPYLEQLITLHLPSGVAEYCHKPAAETSLEDDERLMLIPNQNATHNRYSPVSEAPSLLESDQYKQEMQVKEQVSTATYHTRTGMSHVQSSINFIT